MSAVVALMLVSTACSVRATTQPSAQDSPSDPVDIEQSNVAPPHSGLSDVIARVLPSVVNVRVTSLSPTVQGFREGQGEGSGVVIDSSGIIVTNNHVVADVTSVEIVVPDGEDTKRLEGTVIGTAPERDLAVIRVDASGLAALEIGTSSELELGDEVIAVGFPLGLGATVTSGVISATERNIRVGDPAQGGVSLENVLQTDAAINPGNSGGALVDRNGRLIGINSAAAQAGAAENIGFAIAIDSALPVIEEILAEPPEDKPWLGVYLQPVDDAIRSQLELDTDSPGALIAGVLPESPAESSGLEPGDVVTAIEGEAIASPAALIEKTAQYAPGDSIELTVVSNDGTRTLSAELVARPAQFGQPNE
ncbi:MAG: trypsin-like peptidase domain-containing protein [Actinobacteria bacterium]|nr:trypsin-like peptidase domain-containing protein [Actinomycetota bacterium]